VEERTQQLVYSEGSSSDTVEFNDALIKNLTGEDEVSARDLYKSMIKFKLKIKLNLLTNYTPSLESEFAMVERLSYIFFNSKFLDEPNPNNKNEFKKDKDFAQKLKTIYLDEIFSWVIRGSQEYFKNPVLNKPKSFIEKTNKILSEGDSIDAFIKRKLIFTDDPKDYMKRTEIFDAYNLFSSKNSQKCKPRSTLFQRLQSLNLVQSTLHGYDIFRGIKILDDVPDKIDCRAENELDKKVIYEKTEEEYKNEIMKLKYEHNKHILDYDNEIKELKEQIEALKKNNDSFENYMNNMTKNIKEFEELNNKKKSKSLDKGIAISKTEESEEEKEYIAIQKTEEEKKKMKKLRKFNFRKA
jgi:phage/plasmid-associated DNA primase